MPTDRRTRPGHPLGFTLIELVTVVAIVAILCAVAYPGYTRYVARAKRAQARGVMLEAAQFMERYYTTTGDYATATLPARMGTSPPGADTASADFSIAAAIVTGGYTLTATPNYAEPCGNLTLTHTGVRGVSGTGMTAQECWR